MEKYSTNRFHGIPRGKLVENGGAQVIRLRLTKAQAAKLEAAKPSDKAAFLMGYAQRHSWPKGEHWSFVVTFCDYSKATRAAQAAGLLDRKRRLKAPKKKRSP